MLSYFRVDHCALQLTIEQDVVTLIVTCGEMLAKTLAIIERITTAIDRNKNGAKHLREISIQIKITKQIVDGVVKENNKHHIPAVLDAVGLVKEKAGELEKAAQELSKTATAGKVRAFLEEFIRGDSQIEKFDKLQSELNMAQTTLITSLVVFNDSGTHSDIDISVVEQVNSYFDQFPELKPEANYPKRMLDLIKLRGEPIDDGAFCRVRKDDLKNLMENLPCAEGKIVRIISENELNDFAFMTADVGNVGGGRPHVDTTVVKKNVLRDNSYLAGGPIDFEASVKMQAVRLAFQTKKGDEKFADQALKFIPGWSDLE